MIRYQIEVVDMEVSTISFTDREGTYIVKTTCPMVSTLMGMDATEMDVMA